jgi:thiol-disulfide isomerase/thioredoxin
MNKFIFAAVLFCFLPVSVAKADVDLSKPLDLKFTAVDGRQVDLAKMRGKVVLIDFWATWCPPCKVIAPDILAAYKKYHSEGFEVIGVSVDSDKQGLLDYVKKEGVPWPQYFDGNGIDNEITSRFGIEEFPTLWLIDKKGVVVTTNLRDLWTSDGTIHPVASDATIENFHAELEKLLKAP